MVLPSIFFSEFNVDEFFPIHLEAAEEYLVSPVGKEKKSKRKN